MNFPIPFFAVVMGLSGFSLALQKSEALQLLPWQSGLMMTGMAGVLFVLIAAAYTTKWVQYPDAVRQEFHHPIRLSFFPTISISLILLGTGLMHVQADVAESLWLIGSAAHLAFTLYVLGAWINHEHFQIHHMNPAWFIPVVGNILVPIAGVPFGYVETSWFFFTIGLLFWIVLLVIVMYRVIFHNPLPAKLVPTFFILIAPPAVGFLAWLKLNGGEVDAFARILYYSAMFLTLLLFTQHRKFTRLQFFLSWWAYSFPLAAITVATLAMFEHTGNVHFRTLGMILLAFLSAIIALLIVRTLLAMRRKEVCVED
ncbi:MAG: SLAC1 anion channel family protein [Chromatiales bacterium]|nr:SLAC1 anion channel family protein [Chromatiales bacterium]